MNDGNLITTVDTIMPYAETHGMWAYYITMVMHIHVLGTIRNMGMVQYFQNQMAWNSPGADGNGPIDDIKANGCTTFVHCKGPPVLNH